MPMPMGAVLPALLVLLALGAAARPFEVVRLADGVHAVIRSEPVGLGVDANNLFIVGDDGVVVVDSNFGPSSTREVLAALRELTSKPVTHVINTHPHDDHVLGNAVYRAAFPDAVFVGHAFLNEYLPGTGAVNRRNQVASLPTFAAAVEGALDKGLNLAKQPITDEERAGYASDIWMIRRYLSDAPAFVDVLPTVAVTDRLTLQAGGREIEVLHLGRGHTAGDLVVHLPREGIVAAGDLVVHPIPLVGGDQSYVAEWSTTLEKLIALRPRIIIPGHGPVMPDTAYVARMAELFASITEQVRRAAAGGQSLEEVRARVDLVRFRDTFAGKSQLKQFLFANYVAGPAVASAYRTATAPERAP